MRIGIEYKRRPKMRMHDFCGKILLLLAAIVLFAIPGNAEEIRGYERHGGYQYLQMGEYPFDRDETIQPVVWRILSVENGHAILLNEYVIDTSQVIFETDKKVIEKRTYRRIKTFEESDLYPLVDTEYYDRLFSNEPLAAAIVKDPDHGRLFIPDREFYLRQEYGFSPAAYGENFPTRKAQGTDYATKKRGLYRDSNGMSPYWAATLKNGDRDYKVQLVGYNGHLSYGALTRVNVGLRFAVELDLNKVRVVSGEGTLKDPFVLEYTGPMDEDAASPVPEASEEQTDRDAQTEETGFQAFIVTEEDETTSDPGRTEEQDNETEAGGVPGTKESEAKNDAGSARYDEILISFVGDCSIGDAINSTGMADSYHSVVKREGYAWPFSAVYQYLSEDDLTVANLEVVLTTSTKHKDIMYPLRADPSHVNILLEGSIEVVNTVNNHCYDYKRQGYIDSLAVLDEAKIGRFGSVYYNKQDGFDDLLVRDVKGIRFGFIGITYPQSYDIQPVIERIEKLKQEEHCDIVVVSMHWGRETYLKQNGTQMNIAKKLIDGGADVIYGHHPHVLQPLLFYQGKPVMFSTGNFTFGTMSDVDKHTGIFRFYFRRNGEKVRLSRIQVIPCQTSGKNDYRPVELTDDEQRRKTFQILSPANKTKGFVNPPEYFLENGIILFDEEGNINPDFTE